MGGLATLDEAEPARVWRAAGVTGTGFEADSVGEASIALFARTDLATPETLDVILMVASTGLDEGCRDEKERA